MSDLRKPSSGFLPDLVKAVVVRIVIWMTTLLFIHAGLTSNDLVDKIIPYIFSA